MSDANFEDVLDQKIEDVEKPPTRPVGTYLCAVMGLPSTRDVTQKDGATAKVATFKLKPLQAMEDVSQDALSDPALGEISQWPPRNKDIYGINTPDGLWALKQFLTEVLEIDPAGKSIKQCLAEAPGRQLKVHFTHRPYTDQSGQPAISWDPGQCSKV